MPPDRHWVTPVLYMAMITALSSIPGSTGADTAAGPAAWISPIVANALHVPVYAGLGFLWVRALTRNSRTTLQQAVLLAFIIAVTFGALDEIYQGLVPGRTTALGDWLANGIGAGIGITAAYIQHPYR